MHRASLGPVQDELQRDAPLLCLKQGPRNRGVAEGVPLNFDLLLRPVDRPDDGVLAVAAWGKVDFYLAGAKPRCERERQEDLDSGAGGDCAPPVVFMLRPPPIG